MAIVVRLDRILVERRMTLTQLSERVGITVANLSVLKNGRAKAVKLSTLEAICEALECQPGDLLEYWPHGLEPYPTRMVQESRGGSGAWGPVERASKINDR